MDFYFSQSKSFVLVFFNHLINIFCFLGRGIARSGVVIPWIDYPFFAVALGSEWEERESVL